MTTYTIHFTQDIGIGRHSDGSVTVEAEDVVQAQYRFYRDHNDDFTIAGIEVDGVEVDF